MEVSRVLFTETPLLQTLEVISYFGLAYILYVSQSVSTLKSCVRTLGVDQSTKIVLISIYRLTLHPLAKYPGPFLDRISDWPLVFHCYNGNRHLVEYRNHQKYGRYQ
jgi:hypothetical protein